MKIRKIAAGLLSFALLFQLCSCAGPVKESSETSPGSEVSGFTLPHIGPGELTPKTESSSSAESSPESPAAPESTGTEPASSAPVSPTAATTSAAEPSGEPVETPAQPTAPEQPEKKSGTGYLICIDPGHQAEGNYDTEPNGPGSEIMKSKVSGGTSSFFGRDEEYKVVLEVGLKLREELENRGYEVIMTRTSNDVDISNVERARIANEAGADAFIRLHCNSSENGEWNGTSVICQTADNPYNGSYRDEFYALCCAVICAVTEKTGQKWDGIIERDDMTGINWCQVPTCLLEMVYMSNTEDDARIQDPDFQGRMAEAIADGIDDFLAFRSPREHYPGSAPDSREYPTAYDTDARYTEGSNGLLVCIDAGHQAHANTGQEPVGPGASETKTKVSSGTQGRFTGVPEYEVNLKVALNLEQELVSRGYSVLMIRTSDQVDISNVERATIANEAGADAFIRVHCNGVDNASIEGAGAICQSKNNPYVGEMYSAFFSLCDTIVNEICAVTGQHKYGVIVNDAMSGINWCQVPTALIEMGFMTNEAEDRMMVTEEYQRNVAIGMANGIDRYFGR